MTTAHISQPLDLVISPCLPEELPAVCTLLATSFADIFGSMVQLNEQQLVALLIQTWSPYAFAADRLQVAARLNGQIVGVIGLQWSAGHSSTRSILPHLGSLIRLYGFWNMCRFAIGISALEHNPRLHEGYIEHLATAAEYRGRGIARSLLQWAQRYAAEQKWNQLTLHVSYNNVHASQLYKKIGFYHHSSHSSWIQQLFLQQPGWHYMAWIPESLSPTNR